MLADILGIQNQIVDASDTQRPLEQLEQAQSRTTASATPPAEIGQGLREGRTPPAAEPECNDEQ